MIQKKYMNVLMIQSDGHSFFVAEGKTTLLDIFCLSDANVPLSHEVTSLCRIMEQTDRCNVLTCPIKSHISQLPYYLSYASCDWFSRVDFLFVIGRIGKIGLGRKENDVIPLLIAHVPCGCPIIAVPAFYTTAMPLFFKDWRKMDQQKRVPTNGSTSLSDNRSCLINWDKVIFISDSNDSLAKYHSHFSSRVKMP